MAKTTKHKIRIDAEGNADKKLKDTSKGVDKLADSAEKSNVAFAKMAIQAAAASAALQTMKAVAMESLREFSKLDAATGRLERSYKRLGGNASDLGRASAQARKNLDLYGTSVLGQVDALRRLADASGSMKLAEQDLQLAIDITAAEGYPDLTRATELLAKARKGETEELKNLTGINKSFAEGLGQIALDTDRAEVAMNNLRQTYTGAADDTKGAQTAAEEFQGSLDLLEASLGGVLYALGDETMGVIKAIGQFFGVIDENKSVMDTLVGSLNQMERGIKNIENADFDLWRAGTTYLTTGSAQAAFLAGATGGVYEAGADNAQPQTMEFTEDEIYGVHYGTGGISRAMPSKKNPKKPGGRTPRKPRGSSRKRRGSSSSGEESMTFTYDEVYGEEERAREKQIEHEKKMGEASWRITKWMYDRKEAYRKQFLEKAQKDREEQLEKEKEFEELKAQAAMQSADAIVGMMDQVGVNSTVVAGIRAAMEIGEGIAALAPTPAFPFGNPVGAATHFAAAAQFAVAEAMKGGGGGGGGKKGGASAGAAASMNMERQNRDLERGPRETNITIDFSRSVGVGPQAAQELAKEVSRGMRLASGSTEVY